MYKWELEFIELCKSDADLWRYTVWGDSLRRTLNRETISVPLEERLYYSSRWAALLVAWYAMLHTLRLNRRTAESVRREISARGRYGLADTLKPQRNYDD